MTMHKEMERRSIDAEFRVEGNEGEPAKIVGYAAKFNTMSEEMWGFRETIAPGAFAEALKDSDVRALFNHDPNIVLGRNKAGTLSLLEDSVGLRYEITPPDTQTATDLIASIRRGDVTQSSFAFTLHGGGEHSWKEDADGTVTRTIIKVARLFDVSPVTYPAYPDTESGVRSAEDVLKEYRASREQQDSGNDPEPNEVSDFSLQRARLDLLEVE